MKTNNLENNNTKEWGDVCVRLLQGPLFKNENEQSFEKLQLWAKEINAYFNVIGLKLYYNEDIDYAFLVQNEDGDGNVIGDLTRLLIKHPLTYETSLILIILREELDKFEMEDTSSMRLVIKESEISELIEPYYKDTSDKVKYQNLVSTQLNIIASMGLIKQIKDSSQTISLSNDRVFEIKNILRAKVDAEFLREFKERLEKQQGEEN